MQMSRSDLRFATFSRQILSRSKSSLVTGVSVDQDKQKFGIVRAQNERSMGSHCQKHDTDTCGNVTSNFFLCWTFLERRSQVQEGQADHSPRQKNGCVIGLIGTIEVKKLIVIKVRNAQQITSWTWHTENVLTAPGNRMWDNEDSKTIAQVSQEAGFSANVWKGQYFVTRPSIDNSEGSTLVCKEYTPPRSDPNSQLVCALNDTVRTGLVLDSKTTNSAGPDSIGVLIPSKQNLPNCGGLNKYASQILKLEQFVAEEADYLSHCEESSRGRGQPWANPDKAQPPSDHRKKAIIEKATIRVNSCTSTKSTTSDMLFRHQE